MFSPLVMMLIGCGSPEPETNPSATPQAEAGSPKARPAAPPEPEAAPAGGWSNPGDGIPEIVEADSQTLPSGLRIVTTQVGPGAKPERAQKVKVHYHGWLAETGEQFDSSSNRGTPLEFMLGTGRVIRGWDEGLMQLTKGSKARLYIPAALGYGTSGAGRVIPPNADLVFDVWLVDIGG